MAAAVHARRTAGTKPKAKSRSALDDYDVHEAADMFPLIDDANLEALAADIAEHGQQEPIWMYQGKLLDGRNRVLACALVGKTPIRQEWKPKPGETPATFVMARNVLRRHLSASQRAALAVELEAVIAAERKELKAKAKAANKATAAPFSNAEKAPVALSSTSDTTVEFTSGSPREQARVGEKVHSGRARDKAASTMQVSAGYVNDAKNLKKAAPDKFDQVMSGELTLTRAQDEVVAEAHARGELDKVKLRPAAIRAAMERMEAENRPKRPEKAPPIKLPKASKVTSSKTTLVLTVTFGNAKVAEDWLNRMQDDPKVTDLAYEVRATPTRRKSKTS